MTFLALEMVGLASSASFLAQLPFRQRTKDSMVEIGQVALMMGFVIMGIAAYVILPDVTTEVEFFSSYSPHAYNLIIYPALALLIIRKRFPMKQFLPAFVILYVVQEMIFNGVAIVRFAGNPAVLEYLRLWGWWAFLGIALTSMSVSWFYIRPRFERNFTWAILAAFMFIWAFLAGLPTLAADHIDKAPFTVQISSFAWELMFQAAYWLFIWRSFYPRSNPL